MSGHGHVLKRAAAGIALTLAAAGTAVGTAPAAPAAPAAQAAPAAPAAQAAPAAPAVRAPVKASVKTSGASAPRVRALPKSGIWTAVSAGMHTESPAPAFWVSPNGTGWDVFGRQLGPNSFTYEAVRLNQAGGVVAGPTDIFAIHWGSLQLGPELVGAGAVPLLVFSGIRGTSGVYSLGCVYGALGSTAKWTVEPWSLSADCVNPVPAAAETNPSGKVPAAAWPATTGGSGINVHIGTSSLIPAAADEHIPLTKATAAVTGMTNDEIANKHFYVAWDQIFSAPGGRDGFYVKDVTAGTTRKAPSSGTNGALTPFASLAITNSASHAGVFIAYPANTSIPRLLFWRVGAPKPLTVPSSANAFDVSVAQGPQGRIWVAWYNESTNRLFVTRTNKADTRFGAVRSYATPCFEHGLLGLGGSPLQRLDIGMSCVNTVKLQAEQYITQVRAALTLGFPNPVHVLSAGLNIKITVSDAGDPVSGATVKVDGKTGTTNAAGQATIHLPGGIKAGKYGVIATAASYLAAAGTLTVT